MDTFCTLLSEFQKFNPNDKIKTFLLDKDAAKIGTINKIYPKASILLCYFHVTNNLKDASAKYSGLCTVKDFNLNILYKMLNTPKEVKFFYAYKNLPPLLKLNIDKNRMSTKDSWAKAFTQHVSYGVRTNNIVERNNRILKQHCCRSTTVPNLVEIF